MSTSPEDQARTEVAHDEERREALALLQPSLVRLSPRARERIDALPLTHLDFLLRVTRRSTEDLMRALRLMRIVSASRDEDLPANYH